MRGEWSGAHTRCSLHPHQLSDEQLYQLHELMNVTKEIYDPSKAQSQPPGGQKAVEEAVNEALDRTKKG